MGIDHEAREITIEETGEMFKFRPEKLVNDTRTVLLSHRQLQVQAMPWDMLNEEQQTKEINGMDSLANELVMGIVDIVARGKVDVVHATLDKFTVKDGSTQITATGRADDGALIQLNNFGKKRLKIVVLDEAQFDTERDKISAEPDQQTMFDDGDDDMHDETGEAGEPEGDETEQSTVDAIADAVNQDPAITHDERLKVDPHYLAGFESYGGKYGIDDCPFDARVDEAQALAWSDGWKAGWEMDGKSENEPATPEVTEPKAEAKPKPASKKKSAAKKPEPTPEPETQEEGTAGAAELPPETETDAEPLKPDAWAEGSEACMDGKGAGANPHMDASLRADWAAGFEDTANQLNELENAGYAARTNGDYSENSGFEKGTVQHRSFMVGYDNAKSAELDNDTGD